MLLEHADELVDALPACLSLFGGLYAKENGVPVLAVERRKESTGFGTLVERGLKIGGRQRGAVRIVGSFPTPVFFGVFDGCQAGCPHTATFDQFQGFRAVDL
jgi:hypothetical protein